MTYTEAQEVRRRQLQGEHFTPKLVEEAMRIIADGPPRPRFVDVQPRVSPGVDIDAIYRHPGLVTRSKT